MTLKIKIAIALALIAALAAFGWWARDRWQELQDLRALQEQQNQAQESASATLDSLGVNLAERSHSEVTRRQYTAARERQFEELSREDADVGAWGAARIPQRLRDDERAARERSRVEDPGRRSEGAD